jgi:hypothetical protein
MQKEDGMPRERKTRRELETLVFSEMGKTRDCEGATGVTVRGIADPRVDVTWQVASVNNDDSERCRAAVKQIETRLQQQYDLTDD